MSKLILTLPVAYPVKCVLKRGRNERTIHVKDEVEVEIPRISRTDLTEAVRLRREMRGSPERVYSRLAFEGNLYGAHLGLAGLIANGRRIAERTDIVDERVITEVRSIEQTRQLIDGPNRFGKSLWGYPRDEIVDLLPMNVDRILDSGRDRVQDATKKLFSEMMLVDGVLHERRGPPLLHVYNTESSNGLTLDEHWSPASTMFAPIKLEEAREFGTAFAKRSRGVVLFGTSITAIHVEKYDQNFVPHLFERERNAEAAAAKFIRLVGECLYGVPVNGFQALAQLAQLAERVKQNDPEAADEIVQAIESFRDEGYLDRFPEVKRDAIERGIEFDCAGIRLSPRAPALAHTGTDEDFLDSIAPTN